LGAGQPQWNIAVIVFDESIKWWINQKYIHYYGIPYLTRKDRRKPALIRIIFAKIKISCVTIISNSNIIFVNKIEF
jgi:hypothetical protein